MMVGDNGCVCVIGVVVMIGAGFGFDGTAGWDVVIGVKPICCILGVAPVTLIGGACNVKEVGCIL